jgi:tRNA (guanine37-N1)-methyltransferase
MLRFDILTLFPGLFQGIFTESIIGRAVQNEMTAVNLHNIRDFTTDKHHVTDDLPYGGGGGMVMKPEPIFAAVEHVLGQACAQGTRVVLLTPQGRPFSHAVARELSREEHIILICGRYEGVDERVRLHLATDEISIGDYVLTGGELAAAVVVDAVVRLLPGVLGDPGAPYRDSHADGLLEYPHYTRPPAFRGWSVPDILVSGDHARVARWRRQQALLRTWQRRPDLLARVDLSDDDRAFLASLPATESQRGDTP